MDRRDFRFGVEYVIRDPKFAGEVFRLLKLMRVNAKLKNVDGSGQIVTVSPHLVDPYDPSKPVPVATKDDLVFHPGEPVRWSRRRGAIFVVCRQSKETVTIALLGGEKGMVYRTHPGTLTKVKAKIGGAQ